MFVYNMVSWIIFDAYNTVHATIISIYRVLRNVSYMTKGIKHSRICMAQWLCSYMAYINYTIKQLQLNNSLYALKLQQYAASASF